MNGTDAGVSFFIIVCAQGISDTPARVASQTNQVREGPLDRLVEAERAVVSMLPPPAI